jgi:hypothetical protein
MCGSAIIRSNAAGPPVEPEELRHDQQRNRVLYPTSCPCTGRDAASRRSSYRDRSSAPARTSDADPLECVVPLDALLLLKLPHVAAVRARPCLILLRLPSGPRRRGVAIVFVHWRRSGRSACVPARPQAAERVPVTRSLRSSTSCGGREIVERLPHVPGTSDEAFSNPRSHIEHRTNHVGTRPNLGRWPRWRNNSSSGELGRRAGYRIPRRAGTASPNMAPLDRSAATYARNGTRARAGGPDMGVALARRADLESATRTSSPARHSLRDARLLPGRLQPLDALPRLARREQLASLTMSE